MLQAQLNPAPKVRKIPYFAGRFAPPRMPRYVFLTTREALGRLYYELRVSLIPVLLNMPLLWDCSLLW